MNDSISISQKIYLLGIHPQKGGIISAAYNKMNYVLLGTLFLELYLHKNVIFENKRIILTNRKSQIPLHQFLIKKLESSKHDLKISRWMNKLYFSLKFIRGEVQQELVDKRIIKMKHHKFLFFRWDTPVIINAQLIYRLVNQIENQIFKGTSVEEEILVLSFLRPAGLINRLFPEKNKRKHALTRLKNMMVENQVSQAVAEAITASQAVAASVAATAAASAATSS